MVTTEKKARIGEVFDLTIAALNEDGYGIGCSGEKQILVTGVLPGETVRVKVTFVGRREILASTIKVLRHSTARLLTPPGANAPLFDYFPLLIMKYPAQLEWKRDLVENALRGYSALKEITPRTVLPSPKPLHYRNIARLVIAGKFSTPVIGIYRRNSDDVLDIGDCPLYHPLINRVVQAVRDGIKHGKVPIYSARSGTGLLRYLVIRVTEAENRVMAVFITAQRSFNEIHHLAKFLQGSVPEVEVVVQNVNDTAGRDIFGETNHYLTRKRLLHDTIGDIRYDISPTSYFPENSVSAQTVYEKVREWAVLSGRETVIQLYCGNGGILFYLSRCAKKVIGIGLGERGVTDAEKIARQNGIHNCSFEAGKEVGLLTELRKKGFCPDLFVIEMPRKGCEKEVLQQVVALAPTRIVHLSGFLQPMANDLNILSQLGYRTMEVQPVDMFPQTSRVETASLLVKR